MRLSSVLSVYTNRNSIKISPPLITPPKVIIEAIGTIKKSIIEEQKYSL
jgi:acetylornithine/succinyldiaminopimelate/putrescine aminotransferase